MAQKAEESDPVRYTGWCDVNDKLSNLHRNKAFFGRFFGGFTNEDYEIEIIMEDANDLIDNLSGATDTRGKTVDTLRDLANDLDSLREDIQIAKITGSSRNVSEEAMAALGAPRLEGTGEVTSKAGGVTSGRKEIVKVSDISRDKVKRAQEVLKEDNIATMKVNEIYAKLESIAKIIHRSFPHLESSKTVLCFSLVVSANKRVRHSATSRQRYSADLLATVLARTTAAKKSSKIAKQIEDVSSGLVPKLAGVFTKGAIETAENILARTVDSGIVARGREKPFIKSAFDIDELLEAAVLTGSKSAAAEFLRQVARGFEEQRKEMEQLQSKISELSSENLEEMFEEEFKFLLKTISSTKEVSQELKDEVVKHFNRCEKEEGWYQTFFSLLINPELYVEALANIFILLYKHINPEQLQQSEIDITFLAHGQVRRTPTPVPMLLPCKLFYMNGYVQSIKFYEPWGCAIDATAAYGIFTGTIRVNTVSYSGDVIPAMPTDWNTLPRDYTQIPEVVFTRVHHTQEVYQRLESLCLQLERSLNGLVVPFFSFPEEPAVQAEIPLWALCHAVAIWGFELQKRFRIHVASCLTPTDEAILTRQVFPDPRSTVDCRQYCVVPVVDLHDPVFMRMNLPSPGRPENIPEETFNVLNELLY